MRIYHSTPLSERFWPRVNKTNSCWLWTGGTSAGYGVMWDTRVGHNVGTHRVAWELARGPIPNGLNVCHNCPGGDNPLCCNPAHLFLGTTADNMADAAVKGQMPTGERHSSRTHPERVPRGDRHGSRTHPERLARGDANGRRLHPERYPSGDQHPTRQRPALVRRGEEQANAILTDEQVREIRRRYVPRVVTLHQLAVEYGVHLGTIHAVVARKRWTHVED